MYKHMYLALDPGLTTGYVISRGADIIEMGHLYSLEDVARKVETFVTSAYGDGPIVIYEKFARGNTAVEEQLSTIEVIGAIEAVALLNNLELRSHYPSGRKGWIPVAKQIVRAEGYTLKEMHHAIDALAHLLVEIDMEGEPDWDKQYWLRKVIQSGV